MSISAPLKKPYSELNKLYSIPKEQEGKVWAFLDAHQSLVPILETVPACINELFPTPILELDFRQDPEIEDYEFLRVKIISQLAIPEAIKNNQELNDLLFDQFPPETLSLLLFTTRSKRH